MNVPHQKCRAAACPACTGRVSKKLGSSTIRPWKPDEIPEAPRAEFVPAPIPSFVAGRRAENLPPAGRTPDTGPSAASR